MLVPAKKPLNRAELCRSRLRNSKRPIPGREPFGSGIPIAALQIESRAWRHVVAASRKRKRVWIWGAVALVVLLAVAGVAVARLVKGSSIDSNRIAKVTRGDVARSVVATGKIQPITKVEVKSKASGI